MRRPLAPNVARHERARRTLPLMAVLLETVADLVADPHNPQSIAGRARARRWRELVRRVPDMADLTVVDLGGTVQSWIGLEPHPRRLTVVNLDSDRGPGPEPELP